MSEPVDNIEQLGPVMTDEFREKFRELNAKIGPLMILTAKEYRRITVTSDVAVKALRLSSGRAANEALAEIEKLGKEERC